MSTLRRIVKNAGITFIGNNLLKVLTLFLIILIARYLGVEEYGKFTFALSFTGLFFILMDLGTRILIVREIAQNKSQASKIISNTLILKFISSLAVYLLILSIAFALGYSPETIIAIAIVAIGLIFDSFSTTIGSVFQAYERLEFPVITKLIRILIRFAFTVPLLIGGSSFLVILIIYAGVQFLNFLISIILCYSKFVKLKFDFDKKLIISLLKRSFPFLLSGIFVSIYFNIDVTMMSKLAPTTLKGIYASVSRDVVIGWYSAAYNLLEAVVPLAGAVSAAILPVAVIYFKKSKEKLVRLYSVSVKALVYLSIPIAVGTTLLANKIMLLIYNIEYVNGALALKILIWTIIPLSIIYIMGAIMIAIHKEKEAVIILFVNVVINIVLNIFLIPKYSLYGAAFSTVITEIFYFSAYYFIISKNLHKLNLLKIIIKPMIASTVMGLVIFYFINLNLFLLIGFGIVVYSIIMFLLKAIDEEDKLLIKRVFVEEKF